MCLIKMLETDRQNMLPQVREMFDRADESLARAFCVQSKKLPGKFKGKRATVPMTSLVAKTNKVLRVNGDPRDESVTFKEVNGERVINEATAERLAAIENYRKQVESGVEQLSYVENDDKQFFAMLSFAKDCVENGVLTSEDFEEDM
jgi:hypothetical protein